MLQSLASIRGVDQNGVRSIVLAHDLWKVCYQVFAVATIGSAISDVDFLLGLGCKRKPSRELLSDFADANEEVERQRRVMKRDWPTSRLSTGPNLGRAVDEVNWYLGC